MVQITTRGAVTECECHASLSRWHIWYRSTNCAHASAHYDNVTTVVTTFVTRLNIERNGAEHLACSQVDNVILWEGLIPPQGGGGTSQNFRYRGSAHNTKNGPNQIYVFVKIRGQKDYNQWERGVNRIESGVLHFRTSLPCPSIEIHPAPLFMPCLLFSLDSFSNW